MAPVSTTSPPRAYPQVHRAHRTVRLTGHAATRSGRRFAGVRGRTSWRAICLSRCRRPVSSNGFQRVGAGKMIKIWAVALGMILLMPEVALAASSASCVGGGFSVLGLSGDGRVTVPARDVGRSFLVKGTYVVFTVDSDTFGVRDWTLTGAPNPLDLTGEMPTIVFASKIPDHPGLA